MDAPLAKAIFASRDKAPKDMWEMYTGLSSTRGCLACLPMTVWVDTGASSSSGWEESWAPKSKISSQAGRGTWVPMAADRGFPVRAIWWISFMYRMDSSSRANSAKLS